MMSNNNISYIEGVTKDKIFIIPGLQSLHRSTMQPMTSGFCYSGSHNSTSDCR